MKRFAWLILAAVLLVPSLASAEWKQVTQGDSVFCVDDNGAVARCTTDEKTGKLLIGDALITKAGKCPT